MGRRIAVALVLIAAIAAFFALDLDGLLSMEVLRARQQELASLVAQHPWTAAGAYFALYVLVTALSLPGAAVLTLAGGAIFGLWRGVLLVSFASTIGATLAFLVARFLLRDAVQRRFGHRLGAINRGIEREGAFYLFALRLVPAFPYVLVNLLMALTPLRTWTFYWVSQLGMLPGTVVYVWAGTQLGAIDAPGDLVSPGLIAAFAALGLFPLAARRGLDVLRARRAWRGFSRPRRFDTNLIVIGAGSAGLVSAYIAAATGARVTLIERERMGGDCLNTGCVPSKALLRSARLLADARRSAALGIRAMSADFSFGDVMRRVHEVIGRIAPHDSVERYTSLGVDVVRGHARLVDPWTVEVDGRRISAPNIVVASGAEPFVPPIPGLADAAPLTSDNLWALDELPLRLVVLGGGPIGSELAQAFARLGSQVDQVEMLDRILVKEDPEVSALIQRRFEAEGITVHVGTRAVEVRRDGERFVLVCERGDARVEIPFDRILVAVGRKARTEDLGLDQVGVRVDRTIEVDEFLRTSVPNIYACGDVAGPYQFTHTASHMAWYCAVNALFGPIRKFRVDWSVVPWATFTDPEVARVGLSETEAREQGVAYEVTRYGLDDLDRAICDGADEGFVKVLTPPGSDRILGVTIVGEHAGELIAEFVLAMRHGLGLRKILSTIHIYPTFAEAAKATAGRWQQAHKPERLLAIARRWHAWRRREGSAG